MYGIESNLPVPPQKEIPQGLHIKNVQVYISENSSIVITEDLVLNGARINGQGSIIMKSDSPQKIVSDKSSIAKIIIDNPTEVTLHGKLEITDQLIVKTGVFDISKAMLIINPDNIELLLGGTLFKGKNTQFENSNQRDSVPSEYHYIANVLSFSNNLTAIEHNYNKNSLLLFKEKLHGKTIQKNRVQPPDFQSI